MKRFLTILFFTCFIIQSNSQDTLTINGETLQVNTEVDGELDLLWSITDRTYRYFIRTNDASIIELKSTRGSDGKYQKEFRNTLKNLTPNSNISTNNVSLTVGSLRRFVNAYNKSVDPNFNEVSGNKKVNLRLAFLGGITNHPLVNNIENNSNLVLASELELYGDTENPRHSGLLQARQTFASDGDYKSTEFSLGYRFRIIRKETFNVFVQNRFASLTFLSIDRSVTVGNTMTIESFNETEFEFPLSFGIGADIKVSENSYITFLYDRFFALGLDNRNDFPLDFMIGYKLNL